MGQGQISAFITGAGSDHLNRTIHEIWGFTDPQIENTHDFIQWLFPLSEKSRAVPQSPVLTTEDIFAIKNSAVAQANLRKSALWFESFLDRTDTWLRPKNHNHLRISRVIKSVNILVDSNSSLVFFEKIMEMSLPHSKKMEGVRGFWTNLVLDLSKKTDEAQKSL